MRTEKEGLGVEEQGRRGCKIRLNDIRASMLLAQDEN